VFVKSKLSVFDGIFGFSNCDLSFQCSSASPFIPFSFLIDEDYFLKYDSYSRIYLFNRISDRFFFFSQDKYLKFVMKIDEFIGSNQVFPLFYIWDFRLTSYQSSFDMFVEVLSSTEFRFGFRGRLYLDQPLFICYSDFYPLSYLFEDFSVILSRGSSGEFIFLFNGDITVFQFTSAFSGYSGNTYSDPYICCLDGSNSVFMFGPESVYSLPLTVNFYLKEFEFGDTSSISLTNDDKIDFIRKSIQSLNSQIFKENLDGSYDYSKAFKFVGSDGKE